MGLVSRHAASASGTKLLTSKHVTRSVQFSEPQYQWMRERAAALGITIVELLRRIVDNARGARTDAA